VAFESTAIVTTSDTRTAIAVAVVMNEQQNTQPVKQQLIGRCQGQAATHFLDLSIHFCSQRDLSAGFTGHIRPQADSVPRLQSTCRLQPVTSQLLIDYKRMSDDAKAQVSRLLPPRCSCPAHVYSHLVININMCSRFQAVAEKEKGNEFYKQKKFDQALECYAKAAALNPQDMTFLSNRAGKWMHHMFFLICSFSE
jgi:tetratricopeptide (TPR) repeat protein